MDVGVIGAGSMGRNHVRVYSELKNVDAVSVYDVHAPAAQATADQYGAIPCGSVEELLGHADAVSVCVPTGFHAAVTRQVFAAGLPVLIEKPICASAQEAHDLMKDAPAGVTVGVGHIERFNPVVGEIRKIIRHPLYVEIKRHNPASARVTGSSVVEDLMIHDIDLIINLFFSDPGRVCSIGSDDVCSVLMQCGTVPVALSASRKSSRKIRRISIEEEEFTVEGDFMAQEVMIYRKPGRYLVEAERYVQENIIEKVMVNRQEPLKLELDTFVSCARNGTPFPIPPQEAIRNLEVCERIRSLLPGRGVV